MSDPVIPPTPDPTPEPPKPEPTFTQDQLNRIAAKEKDEGRQAALREISEKLGMPVEDATKYLTAAKEREEAEKTELQKLTDALEATKTSSATEISSTKSELISERVKNQLLLARVPLPDEAEKADAALGSLVSLVNASPESTIDEIRTKIDALKEQFPALFTATTTAPTPPPNSVPSGQPTRTPPVGETSLERAQRLAQENNKARGVQVPTA